MEENNKKINILVLYEDNIGGVGYYRSVNPHTYLALKYPNEFNIDIIYQYPNQGNFKEFFGKYDIIQFHKMLDVDSRMIDLIRDSNPKAKIVCDIDDYYKLPKEHPAYYSSTVVNKVYEKIINCLKKVDYITTTTPIFAKYLYRINPNVEVLPNAINALEKQFKLNKTFSNRIRFGIVCGSSHLHDVKLLESSIKSLPNDIWDKIQICLCGFNTEGTYTSYDKNGQKTVRKITPQESVYYEMEKILTKNYSIVSEEHKRFLLSFTPNVKDPFINEPYVRYWTLPIDSYYQHYNNIDVLLAPLVENTFNEVKSQLKLIESGFANVATICQNFGPYTIDTIPFIEKGGKINENGNTLLVDSVKNHKQWAKYITLLANNPNYIKIMSKNLSESMIKNYSIETVNEKRAEFYRKILSK